MIFFVSKQKRVFADTIQERTIQDCLAYFENINEIAVDTETQGFDPHTKNVLSIQIGHFENQFVVDCTTVNIAQLKPLLENENKVFLFHNAKFDLKFLYKHNIYPKKVYDTFLAECILTTGWEERELSLKWVAHKYCGVTLDKSIRGTIHIEGLTDRVIVYGADDVKYLPLIKEKQLVQIEHFNLHNLLRLENEVVKVFARMEFNGAPLNKVKWQEVSEQVETNVKALEEQMDALIYTHGIKDLPKANVLTKYCEIYKQGNMFFDDKQRDCNINWSSPAQKTKLLQDLGLKVTSVDDKTLQKLKTQHPIVPLLITYSKQNKLATSFGKDFLKFVNPVTGRVHGNVWQVLSTGRISISEPNINQIPSHGPLAKLIRASFEAPKGYKFVGGDYSGRKNKLNFIWIIEYLFLYLQIKLINYVF